MNEIEHFVNTATISVLKELLEHCKQRKNEGMKKVIEFLELTINKHQQGLA